MERNDFKPLMSIFPPQNGDPTLLYVYINQGVNHDSRLKKRDVKRYKPQRNVTFA
jgi:hypothetical protein